MSIILSRRLERPLPHLDYAYQPRDMGLVEAGFLALCGFDFYKAGCECDLHFHDSEEYWVILDGRAAVRCGDEAAEVGHGDIVFTPPGVKHQFRAVSNVGVLWLHGKAQGRKREGHLHGEPDEPPAPTPLGLTRIIPHVRTERPLPHLRYNLAPRNLASVQEGFIKYCGIDYYAAGAECEPHFHDCDEYWFIVEGRAAVRCGDETGEAGVGDIVHTPMGTEHQFHAITDTGVLWIYDELKGRKRLGHLHEADR